MKKKVLITSALLYANGPLHFGHLAGAFLPADVYARFQRMQGKEVLFISGSDEYGLPITLNAEKEGKTYKEYIDHFHGINSSLFEKMNLSFDHYSRTTNAFHAPLVQQFFSELLENGYIEKKQEKRLFSEKENKFLADRYVVGKCPKCSYEKARGDECPKCAASFEAEELIGPKSSLTGSSLILKESLHWYIRLDLFKEKLLSWVKKKKWKETVFHFAKNYIEELRPRAITRDSSWGVTVPLEEAKEKVFYVWFDAPIGYISATQEWAEKTGQKERWKEFWQDPEVHYVQFIGKDNIPFHAAFFPSMILGQTSSYKLVDVLSANEFFLLEGRQFSKSEGWFIDLNSFLQRYSVDQLRYTLCANAPETSDSDFSFKDFQKRSNTELLGKFGNFIHRTLTFCHRVWGENSLPKIDLMEEDKAFIQEVKAFAEKIATCYEAFSPKKAALEIMNLAQKANAYFDCKKPWALLKNQEQEKLFSSLYAFLECVKTLSVVSFPIIPESARMVLQFLSMKNILDKGWKEALEKKIEGPLLPPKTLFSKIEDEQMEKEIESLQGSTASKEPHITFEEFQKVKLKVAEIVSVEKIEKSKRLLKLEVSLGEEKRTVVSGIAEHFSEESLIGKKVLLVANLKPTKIMGIQSEGMILAAEHSGKLELPSIQDLPAGSQVS